MGRRPLGDRALTNAEKKRRWRILHRARGPWDLPLSDELLAFFPDLAVLFPDRVRELDEREG